MNQWLEFRTLATRDRCSVRVADIIWFEWCADAGGNPMTRLHLCDGSTLDVMEAYKVVQRQITNGGGG